MLRVMTALLFGLLLTSLGAQEPEATEKKDRTLIADVKPDKALLDKFKKLMTGAKLTGMFTIDGRPLDKLVAESYEIEKVEKLPDGDEWLITARIKYGDKDAVFPCPVEVKWAGKTHRDHSRQRRDSWPGHFLRSRPVSRGPLRRHLAARR